MKNENCKCTECKCQGPKLDLGPLKELVARWTAIVPKATREELANRLQEELDEFNFAKTDDERRAEILDIIFVGMQLPEFMEDSPEFADELNEVVQNAVTLGVTQAEAEFHFRRNLTKFTPCFALSLEDAEAHARRLRGLPPIRRY